MSIAKLRHRITFQEPIRVANDSGGFTNTWTNLVNSPTVWAEVKPVSAKERLYAQQVQYQRSHKVTIRFRHDITQEMRFKFDDRYFQIKGVRNIDERGKYLEIDAEENQGS